MGVLSWFTDRQAQKDAAAAQQLQDVRTGVLPGGPHGRNGRYLVVVNNVYQRAQRGTKAMVTHDNGYRTDAWFKNMGANSGWVVVVHGGVGYGPHNDRECLYIDSIEYSLPGDIFKRARRHQKRMQKQAAAGRY